MRFAAMQDPCDHWLVYDLMSALPAEVEGRLLMGLTRREAEQLVHDRARLRLSVRRRHGQLWIPMHAWTGNQWSFGDQHGSIERQQRGLDLSRP